MEKRIPLPDIIPLFIRWGRDRGLHNTDNLQPQFVKLAEELGEIAAGIARGNDEKIVDSVGDLLVVLTQFGVIHANNLGIDQSRSIFNSYLEMCANAAWSQIKDRSGQTVDDIYVKSDEG